MTTMRMSKVCALDQEVTLDECMFRYGGQRKARHVTVDVQQDLFTVPKDYSLEKYVAQVKYA